MKHDKKIINLLLLILCLLPVYNVVEFYISILISLKTGKLIGWHGWADNYRFFDSMLLLPICLSLYFSDKKNIFSKYFIFLYFFYILMLFFDGARSVLLSILISKVLVFYIYPDKRKLLTINVVLLFLAFMVHKLYLNFNLITINSVFRESTSGRYELWVYGLNRFFEKPFWGQGGANFSLDTPLYLTSPHNFIIQFISEWGIGGILMISLLFFLYFYLFKNREKINPFIFICAISILIDGLFSGIFISPITQMNFLLVIGFLLSQIHQYNDKKEFLVFFNKFNYKYIFYIIAFFCFGYFLLFHWRDITCLNCMGMEGVNTPRFWRGGKSLHLQEIN
ncbi:O-antigen ligase [Acinetobacter sp. YH12102]|uniref:O-antigen ligase family protein n=1 Tax=Acinetobacter sp. YH12102 TaxID=2601091 RepID=UPI0015D3C789|nr:O-antigen ligase family protein [Acinetobacter sp. YH12102]